ncbi:potassium channel family protein [Bacillus salinus]|uniref:potassium channel family protein n=1 Tax=Bacillus sp. HMF5848 TaxID=2495421 RepID=UPI0021ADC6FC|nr:potassium channel family protein [Bacillus sp. HMF5848]
MYNYARIIYYRSPLLVQILAIAFSLIIIFGTLLHFIEPDTFPTLFDGVWWALVSVSTVGYGDYVPTSVVGRIVAMLLILLGTGFITAYFASISGIAATNQQLFLKGETAYKGNEQIIIVGWNERTKGTIDELLTKTPPVKIVLIDASLKENPYASKGVHFIKGDATRDDVIQKANIQAASMVLITADQSKDEVAADMQTVLTILAVKGLKENVYCIAEILTSHQLANAKRAGADQIVETNLLSSFVMINNVLSHGTSPSLLNLLKEVKDSKVCLQEAPTALIGATFLDVTHEMLQNESSLILGIKRGASTYVNPPTSFKIEEHDLLIAIIH